MADVLVTGGSGFLGQHLIAQLRAAGAAVRALSRSPRSDRVISGLGAEPVRGALDDADRLGAAVGGVDVVFHTAADTTQWRPHNPVQTATNVEGTKALVDAACAANVSLFVHTSSVSAYSHLVHDTLREDVPQRGAESWINYERTKHLGEQVVRASKLPFVIVQPAHIFGPGDTRNWARLIQLVDQRRLPGAPPGSGAFADVREVARAQIMAWQRHRVGQTYVLGGEHARFVELIAMIGQRLGRPTPRRPTPAWVLRSYAKVLDALSRLTGKMPPITPEAAMFTCHDLRVDSSKAIAELDYRQTPLPQLIDDTIAWLRQAGLLTEADSTSSA